MTRAPKGITERFLVLLAKGIPAVYEMLEAALVEELGAVPKHVSRNATAAHVELASLSPADLGVTGREETGVRAEDPAAAPDLTLGLVAEAFERAVAAACPAAAAR